MKVFWQQCEGQEIDGFPLRQYLGGGEDKAVFLTEIGGDPARKAAIKLSHADPESSEVQLRRWRLASELSHPNLMRLFERGTWQLNPGQLNKVPLLYVVMEYADEDLSQVIPERPLTAQEGKEVLEPALSALAYLHSHGFVHGHLKPSNFMAVENRLKISSDSVSQIGPGSLTPAEDAWGLGMTLVEVLTQRPPISNSPASDPAVPDTLPPEFRDIARNTLRRDPAARWTIEEIQQRLSGKTPSIKPIPSKPVTSKAAASPPARRFSASAVSTILLAGALVVVAGALLIRNREGSPLAPAAAQEPTPAQPVPAQSTPVKPSPLAPPPVERRETKPSPTPKPKGEIVLEVMPDVLPRARNSIHGKVTAIVRLEVDSSGNVAKAALESPGSSQYFSDLAVQAAKRWRFAPADQSRVWTVKFEFTRTGTKVATAKSG
jgi:TonB family protein